MPQKLSEEYKAKFLELLGLPKDASHQQIVDEMKLASEAQDLLSTNNFVGASKPVLLMAQRLITNRTRNMADAYMFWHWFFVYDAEHNLGFHEAAMRQVRIITE